MMDTLDNVLLVKLGRVSWAQEDGRYQTLAGGSFGRIVHRKDGGTATAMSSVLIVTELLGGILDLLDVRDLLTCRAVSLSYRTHCLADPTTGMLAL